MTKDTGAFSLLYTKTVRVVYICFLPCMRETLFSRGKQTKHQAARSQRAGGPGPSRQCVPLYMRTNSQLTVETYPLLWDKSFHLPSGVKRFKQIRKLF